MPNFVYDGSTLPNGKTDARPLTGIASQNVTAGEWNTTLQASLDMRTAFLNGAINIKTYGAVGDGVTNDYPAFASAIASLSTTTGGTIFVPHGVYKLNSTLTIDKPVIIIGAGNPTEDQLGTTLEFPQSTAGLIITRAAEVRSLCIKGPNNFDSWAGTPNTHGIELRKSAIKLRDIFVIGFNGDGVYVNGSGGFITDFCTLDSVRVYGCGSNGFRLTGADANACTFSTCSAIACQLWGFDDDSFLGNSFFMCHTSENGESYRANQAANSTSFFGCYTEAGQNTVLNGNAIWYAGIAPLGCATWRADFFQLLGARRVNGANEYVCVTAGRSATSGGPTGTGTGITDGTAVWDYVGPAANGRGLIGGQYTLNAKWNGTTLDLSRGAMTIGNGGGTPNEFLFGITADSASALGNTRLQFQNWAGLARFGVDQWVTWVPDNSASNPRSGMALSSGVFPESSGFTSNGKTGRAVPGGTQWFTDFLIGAYAGANGGYGRRVTCQDDLVFASGRTHQIGDVIMRANPTAADPSPGWICVTSGTSGTYAEGLTATSTGVEAITFSGASTVLKTGDILTINGVTAPLYLVNAKSPTGGSTFPVIPAGSGLAIAYSPPVFVKLGGLTDNGTSLALPTNRAVALSRDDSTGTPGSATLNTPRGRSSIAAGAATMTVTNSLVTATSQIIISPRARDATGLLPIVTAGAGNFTVTTTANCTAALPFDWVVVL